MHSYLSAIAYHILVRVHVAKFRSATLSQATPPRRRRRLLRGTECCGRRGTRVGVGRVSWARVCPHSLSPIGKPSFLGQSRCVWVCWSFSSGVSALGYPSGLAGPPDGSVYGGGQMSSSLATGVVRFGQSSSSKLESSLTTTSSYSTSRQPPSATAAAAETAAAEGPTLARSP